ncbi:MAG: hypothetical protein ACN4F8_17100, partial [Hydrogenophaga sp.]
MSRERTPPDLKWLLNERAAVAGELASIEAEVKRLSLRKEHLLRVQTALGDVYPQVAPTLPFVDAPPVKANTRYGGRGNLINLVRATLRAAHPACEPAMNTPPFHRFKPISEEQLRALSEKEGWTGKERGVEPEEVGITEVMMRDAVAPTTQKTSLDALRAFITPSTAAQAREREAADERESKEQPDGFGEDPTPLDQFLQEQGLKPIGEKQHAAIAAAEPATRGAVVDSLLDEPDAQDAAFLEQRDASVTDAQLIERMNNAPDMGGSIIAEHLAQETGVPAEMLRTLAGISDPKNEHQFTAEAARKAFAGVEVLRRVTKPKSVVEAVRAAVRRYGTAGRENVSNDDASGSGPSHRNPRGVDVRSLKPTPP